MSQVHIESLKLQQKEFAEVVDSDLERFTEMITNILEDTSEHEKSAYDVSEKLQVLTKNLEAEMNQLVSTEAELTCNIEKQRKDMENAAKQEVQLQEEYKKTSLALKDYKKIFEHYADLLQVIIKQEKVEGNFHTVNIHFVGNENCTIKLINDIKNKTIVSVCLDNLPNDERKAELLRYLEDHKECTPFLIKLRDCISSQNKEN